MPQPRPANFVTATKVLSAALSPSSLQFRFIILDCIWRFLWLVVSSGAALIAGGTVLSQFRSLTLQGPDLGISSPILLLVALQQFWNRYGAALIMVFGLLFLVLVLLWVGLLWAGVTAGLGFLLQHYFVPTAVVATLLSGLAVGWAFQAAWSLGRSVLSRGSHESRQPASALRT